MIIVDAEEEEEKGVRVWRRRQEGGEHGQKEIRTRRQRGEEV